MASGSAGSAGLVIGQGGKRHIRPPNEFGGIDIDELEKQAEKIGFGPELKDIIEEVAVIHTKLKKKNLELSLLEIIAMESIDENISDLRQQLFTTVRLIHGDEIQEILNDENQMARLANFDTSGLLPDAKPRSLISERQELQNGIISRFRKYFRDYRQLRVEVRELKKNWKHRNGSSFESDDDRCDSGG